MPLQPLYLEADSLRIGANQFLTQSNAVYVGNNLHVGNTLIFGSIGGGANNQWAVPAYSNNKIVITANNNTPAWGTGAIDLRVGTSGGRIGLTFSSNVNSSSDHGYIYYYDNVSGGYSAPGGSENGLMLIGVQNDNAGTSTNEDIVAVESPGNIYINPGMGVDQRTGATSWSNTQGNLWIGNNSIRYLSIHEGLQAPFTLRAPITFANSANALVFSGATNTSITMRTSPNGVLSFDAGAGSLLTLTNNTIGQIFSVNDLSGFPLLEVTANTITSNTLIQMGQYGAKVSVGSNTTPNARLHITSNSTVSAVQIEQPAGSQPFMILPGGASFVYAGSGVALRSMSEFRFSDAVTYSYDAWGGLRWVNANNTMIIGGPGAPGISNNTVVSSNIVMHNATTGNFMVANSTAINILVGANGNIGVGNTTPASKLVVDGTATVTGMLTLNETTEVLNTKTGATGTVAHDLSTGAIFYHTSAAANFTVNLTNVPTTDSRTITVTLIIVQGATAYIPNAFQIDGSAQTIKWQGGVTPAGTSNKTDVVTFSLVRTGAAWAAVIGSLASYG